MAEETKNTYRYIDTDMDRDLLVKNLNHNVQDYVKHKGWDSSKASEFYDALNTYMDALNEGRLSTSRSGSLLDSAGILDNGSARWRDKNGNVISQADYNAMKKRKRKNLTNDFYPHREVAGYFNTVAKAFYDAKYNPDKQKKEGEKPAEKFDLGTHGLWNQFVLSLNPSGEGDLQTWMKMDEWNPTEKTRPTTERAKYLGQFIDTYLSKLPENQDFSNYNFTRQEYADLARKLQQELQNGATDVDFRLLERLGANPASYQAYFSTAEKPEGLESENEEKESETSKKEKETTAQLQKLEKSQREAYNKQQYQSWHLVDENAVPQGIKYDTKAENKQEAYKQAFNDANKKLNLGTDFFSPQKMSQTNGHGYVPYLEQYAEIHPDEVREAPNGNKYAGWNYFPKSFNNTDGSVLAYNPTTHRVKRIFYGDLGSGALEDYRSILRNLNIETQANGASAFQAGGQFATGTAGDYEQSLALANEWEKARVESSAKTKADPKLRRPWQEASDYSNNELTFTDKARIGAVLADIVAMVDPGPARSAILGLGSDAVNFWADMHEGYGFRKAAGNFAANAALSAVGIIPIFGQAAGSGGKVVKTLIKMAPKLNRALLAAGIIEGLSNGDEILHSFKKLGKDGPENQMNVEDWRNIAMGLQLLVGGAHAARSAHTSKKLKEFGDTGQKLVTVVDKSKVKPNGDESEAIRGLLFGNKETIAELKAAEKQGPEAVQKVIDSYKSMKGKYVLPTEETSNRVFFSKNKGFKKFNPLTWIGTQKGSKISGDYMTDFIDYEAIRRAYNNGKINKGSNIFSRWWNAELNWIAKNGNYGWNLETVPATNRIYAKHAKVTKEAPKATSKSKATSTSSSAATPAVTPTSKPASSTTKLSRADIAALRPKASAHYKKLSKRGVDITKSPHSTEGQKLIDAGYKPETLLNHGLWRQGGKLIPKGEIGLYTANFTSGVPDYTFEVPPLKFNPNQSWMQGPMFGPLTLDTSAKPGGKNYGEGYESTLDYANKEYGVEGPVNLSAIQKANAGKRDIPNLKPIHGAKDYDYTNAQANTDRARAMWQSDANNRINDFKSWATNWYATHQNGTQAQMLADYNNAIDNMYRYKHEMGTDAYSGEGSYRHGNEVTNFNRTNKDIYGSANSANGVHGYSSGQESWNGTTTAQRFIDITDTDINDFDWDFGEDEDENFKNLFTGLVKDTTGRYYVQDPDIPAYQSKTDVTKLKLQTPTMPYAPAVKETKIPEEGGEGGQTDKASKFNNLTGILADMRANSIAVGRYLAARNLNRRLLNIAKDMPTLLYQPMEAQRWVRGDQNAIQQGYQAAGQLGHLASQPITANGAEQMATMLEARDRGQNYINQGYNQNDQVANATTEAVWNQAGANQQSRYDSSTKNKENLFSTRVNYLTSLGQKYRADQESLNGLLSQWETQLRENDVANKAYREAVAKASLQNQITANLAANGIDATPEDQKMFNDLMTGKKQLDDLTPEETASYNRISNAISEQVTKKMALSKGAVYTPFTPNSAYNTDNWEVSIPYKRKGGLLAPDSEKITIQKLRGSIQKMLARQRHFEARLNAFEKDMDRSHKGADSYIKGQKKSK